MPNAISDQDNCGVAPDNAGVTFGTLLTLDEVAVIVRRSVATVRRWTRDGSLKCVRTEHALYVRASDLSDWLNAGLLRAVRDARPSRNAPQNGRGTDIS